MEFWSFHVITFILLSFFLVILGEGFFTLKMILVMVMLLPVISVSVRRLHDIGSSGWWIFWGLTSFAVPLAIWLISWASSLFAAAATAAAFFFLFPIVGIILAASNPGALESGIFRDLILASVPGIVMTIIITIMCLTDGDPETNKYGPNPKLNPTDPNNPI